MMTITPETYVVTLTGQSDHPTHLWVGFCNGISAAFCLGEAYAKRLQRTARKYDKRDTPCVVVVHDGEGFLQAMYQNGKRVA